MNGTKPEVSNFTSDRNIVSVVRNRRNLRFLWFQLNYIRCLGLNIVPFLKFANQGTHLNQAGV